MRLDEVMSNRPMISRPMVAVELARHGTSLDAMRRDPQAPAEALDGTYDGAAVLHWLGY